MVDGPDMSSAANEIIGLIALIFPYQSKNHSINM